MKFRSDKNDLNESKFLEIFLLLLTAYNKIPFFICLTVSTNLIVNTHQIQMCF